MLFSSSLAATSSLCVPGEDSHFDQAPAFVLLDSMFQSFLLGALLSQAASYYDDYRDDSKTKRAYVVLVVLLTIFQTIIENLKVWDIVVNHRHWSSSTVVWMNLPITGAIVFLGQAFFIRRCWKMLNRTNWLLYPCAILATTTFVSVISLGIETTLSLEGFISTPERAKSLQIWVKFAFTYWIFGSTCLDALLAVIMTVKLYRSKTGLEHSDKVIMRIIRITCESALLPMACMLTAAGVHRANGEGKNGKENMTLFFVLLTGKVYPMVVLRTLNSRAHLRTRMKSHELGRTSLSDVTWRDDTAVAIQPIAFTHQPAPNFSGYSMTSATNNFQSSCPRLIGSEDIAPHEDVSTVISTIRSEMPIFPPSTVMIERGISNRASRNAC